MLGREDGRLPRRSAPTSCSSARPADWPAALEAGSPPRGCTVGVDTILDVVGGDEVDRNLRVVRTKGTIVQVGLMGGGKVEVNVGLLLDKRARWVGTTLRAPTARGEGVDLPALRRRGAAAVHVRRAACRSSTRRFPLAEVAAAHEHMEADANVGKILLDVR